MNVRQVPCLGLVIRCMSEKQCIFRVYSGRGNKLCRKKAMFRYIQGGIFRYALRLAPPKQWRLWDCRAQSRVVVASGALRHDRPRDPSTCLGQRGRPFRRVVVHKWTVCSKRNDRPRDPSTCLGQRDRPFRRVVVHKWTVLKGCSQAWFLLRAVRASRLLGAVFSCIVWRETIRIYIVLKQFRPFHIMFGVSPMVFSRHETAVTVLHL